MISKTIIMNAEFYLNTRIRSFWCLKCACLSAGAVRPLPPESSLLAAMYGVFRKRLMLRSCFGLFDQPLPHVGILQQQVYLFAV